MPRVILLIAAMALGTALWRGDEGFGVGEDPLDGLGLADSVVGAAAGAPAGQETSVSEGRQLLGHGALRETDVLGALRHTVLFTEQEAQGL